MNEPRVLLVVVGMIAVAVFSALAAWFAAEAKFKPRRNQRGQFVR